LTVGAIASLVVLNLGFAAVGGSLLWGLRGWRWWTEVVPLVGLAYFLGIAALVVVLSFEVVVGIPFGPASVLGTCVLLVACGLGVGSYRRRPRPGLAPPGWRVPSPSLLVALMAAGVILWLEAAFRAARLQPLWQIDAWGIWTSRAKSLFYTGELGGAAVLRNGDPGELYYPPGLSLLQAQAFEVIGTTDTVTLHLQHWFFALGFLAAVFGLLHDRARATILLPVVLLVLVTPTFDDIAIWPIADPLLGYLASIAAILMYLWLEDGARWRLASATLLLAGAVLVKREAVLVVACIYAAAALASWSRKRTVWPSLCVAGVATILASVSYRMWLFQSGGSDSPTGGLPSVADTPGRSVDSVNLVASAFLGRHWGLPVLLALAGVVAALAVRSRSAAMFVSAFLLASVATASLVIWAEQFAISQNLSANPVLRMALVAVLVLCPLTAILFEDAWRGTGAVAPAAHRSASRRSARVFAGWAVIAAAVLLYPVSALFAIPGPTLPGGRPLFPERPSPTAMGAVEHLTRPPTTASAGSRDGSGTSVR
jgi:hypothetical protein